MATRQTATQTVPDPFLPPDYKRPETGGNYFKVKDGENVVRILAQPVFGNLGWSQDGNTRRPVRKRMGEDFAPGEVVIDAKNKVRHFWAMPVWNYASGSVQVWEVTQSTIQEAIENLAKMKAWGSPLHYDISITRKGEGMDTEYAVNPLPKEPLNADARAAWDTLASHGFDLNCLFAGLDPFTLDGNGNGNGAAHKSEPGGSLSHLRRFFALLDEAIKAGVWDKGIKADTEDGRTERRKLLSTLLGVTVDDPKTLTADQWAVACDGVQRIIEKNTPGADDDIPF